MKILVLFLSLFISICVFAGEHKVNAGSPGKTKATDNDHKDWVKKEEARFRECSALAKGSDQQGVAQDKAKSMKYNCQDLCGKISSKAPRGSSLQESCANGSFLKLKLSSLR